MIRRSAEGMRNVCSRIIVVGGHEFLRLEELVAGIPGVECVRNPHYRMGMFTSVKCGLARVRARRCFVLPADIPLVPPGVYEQLLLAHADIAVPTWSGRRGHPVCCSRDVIPRILEWPDTSSFRDATAAIGTVTVPVDAEEILIDVDTPEDLVRVQGRIA
jgi:molybdenum cofactor cytidylyltransferase